MIQSYEEAINWIHGRLKFGIKPGLARMNWMLEKLNHPERRVKFVHIAGTNGKGSTVTYMRMILQKAEYKVGTFTSPYIEHFNERISINGAPILDEDILKLVNTVKPIVEECDKTDLGEATEFEIITVIALYYFAVENICDIVLLETGLGGRYDSTNVVYPLLSIITTIGHDHMHILGDTLEKIAFEKAGIVKAGIPVVTGVSQQEALDVITSVAQEKRAKKYVLGSDFAIKDIHSEPKGETFSFSCAFQELENVSISMKGEHQVQNASLALMGIYHLKMFQSFLIDEAHIREGLQAAYWIGRFEQISDSPTIIIDGAHNPEGVESLVKTVKAHYSNRRIVIMFSALGDKKLSEMVASLETIASKMIFTTFSFHRAVSADLLASHCQSAEKEVYDNWRDAYEHTAKQLNENDVLLITGSLYFIAEVRKYVIEENR
ncbi:bifunctional folylpolyglutamate synthase/dihydrofolate synthase [Ectobacillus polymachus]|uniref:bifunctional folylpolyglutamate synthase/dihydrofolate synthase n=1 Tax=Ectobacillus polymachus TaxID=1508806 RepID=UPI003A8410FE